MRRFRFVVPVLLLLGILSGPSTAFGQVSLGFRVTIAPPLLPVYVQPPIPEPSYIWTPGYWAYGPYGYYWVPGTWVQPPTAGLLWTPGYWGWNDGVYAFNSGYWGSRVGFYGGINYGYGYTGVGYQGGYWRNGAFNYNRAVNNISDVHVNNVYNRTVVNNTTINRVSYNGGNGGTVARPTSQELALAREPHTPPTPVQVQHQQIASGNHALLASVNQGHPPIAATSRPTEFSGPGVVPARNAAERAGVGTPPGAAIPGAHGAASTAVIAHEHGEVTTRPGGPAGLRAPAEAVRHGTAAGVPAAPGARAPTHRANVEEAVRHAPAHPAAIREARPTPHPAAHPAAHPQRTETGPHPDARHEEKRPPG